MFLVIDKVICYIYQGSIQALNKRVMAIIICSLEIELEVYSTKKAIQGELGRFPMYNDIVMASFKFINHIENNLDNDSYAKEALKAQKTENYLWWNNIKVIANSLKIIQQTYQIRIY